MLTYKLALVTFFISDETWCYIAVIHQEEHVIMTSNGNTIKLFFKADKNQHKIHLTHIKILITVSYHLTAFKSYVRYKGDILNNQINRPTCHMKHTFTTINLADILVYFE